MAVEAVGDENAETEIGSMPAAVSMQRPAWRRWLDIAIGVFFVVLAVLGIMLPVLPTAPFVLLASYFFARSSPALHRWLLASRLFGPFLRDWEKHHGVRRRVKYQAVGLISIVVGSTLIFASIGLWLKGMLIALAAIGLYVIARLRVIPETAV